MIFCSNYNRFNIDNKDTRTSWRRRNRTHGMDEAMPLFRSRKGKVVN